ncbi:helicase-associated domain-containing protein [Kutzneria viridogrisea]|uniref:Helicase XPB/Ssl2 N-terminal domain-containing protein n=1 Tax=Kutzneria viridogrisea TaxID=47990 RepID=A0ABR6BL19_9PSEU|nr:hypothetical protein [Kutzneria viridogrisea]
MTSSALLTWLRQLEVPELALLLGLRADVLPERDPPRSLDQLAVRLCHPRSVQLALADLDATCLGVLTGLRLLGDQGQLTEIAPVFGDLPAAELARALDTLRQYGILLSEGSHWELAEPFRAGDSPVLGLGVPATRLLAGLTGPQVIGLADRLRLGPALDKADAVALVAEHLGDADRIRAVARQAPAEVEELLEFLVHSAPDFPSPPTGEAMTAVWGEPDQRWLMERGLLLPAPGYRVQMPREVGIALRGPGFSVPVRPRPPEPTMIPISQSVVDGAASVAASATLHAVTRLVELSGSRPLTWRRSGGLGVRELRRVAKALDCAEPAIRLWAALAARTGLLTREGDQLVPTAGSDTWRGLPADFRLGTLLNSWWTMPATPSAEEGPAFLHEDNAETALRTDLVGSLSDLGWHAFVDLDEVASYLGWRRPVAHRLVHGAESVLLHRVRQVAREAELLGVLARDCASTLARCLVEGSDPPAGWLPGEAGTARFGADLTAVVVGLPSGELTALLDGAAELESRDTASVWRFSWASVRRALDGGQTAESLLDRLRAVSAGDLPQPLEYLVTDVARRHGELLVSTVGCCVSARDPAVLAELAAHSELRELDGRLLAPTVLACSTDAARTLELLRANGYAPVATDETGAIAVERPEPLRAARAAPVPQDELVPGVEPRSPAELVALAEELLAAPGEGAELDRLLAAIRESAEQLSEADSRALAQAVLAGTTVQVEFARETFRRPWWTHGTGEPRWRRRLVRPLEVADGLLHAQDVERGERTQLALAELVRVIVS